MQRFEEYVEFSFGQFAVAICVYLSHAAMMFNWHFVSCQDSVVVSIKTAKDLAGRLLRWRMMVPSGVADGMN